MFFNATSNIEQWESVLNKAAVPSTASAAVQCRMNVRKRWMTSTSWLMKQGLIPPNCKLEILRCLDYSGQFQHKRDQKQRLLLDSKLHSQLHCIFGARLRNYLHFSSFWGKCCSLYLQQIVLFLKHSECNTNLSFQILCVCLLLFYFEESELFCNWLMLFERLLNDSAFHRLIWKMSIPTTPSSVHCRKRVEIFKWRHLLILHCVPERELSVLVTTGTLLNRNKCCTPFLLDLLDSLEIGAEIQSQPDGS